ncbi:MAG: hypothetical protein ABSE16_12160 [Verrucomicrobiota bacterium]
MARHSLPGYPPARLTAEQTAWVLNCQKHYVPILVAQAAGQSATE